MRTDEGAVPWTTHLRFYSQRTLRSMVRRAGFDVVEEARTGLPLGVVAPRDSTPTRVVRRADRALVGLRPSCSRTSSCCGCSRMPRVWTSPRSRRLGH